MKNLKSKLCSALALILALSMILPIGVFADSEPITIKNAEGGTSTTVDYATSGAQVCLTASGGSGSGAYTWECYQSDGDTPVTNEDVTFSATNEATKTFTFKKVGTYRVKAYKISADAAWYTVTINKKFVGIEVDEKIGIDKTHYVAGQSFRKSDITVYKKYEGAEREALNSSDYTIEPATLAVDTTSVKVKYDEKEATISGIQVEAKAVVKVRISMPSTVFTAGDSLPELTVKLIMNDGTESTTTDYDYYINGQKVNAGRKLTTADEAITIKVGNVISDEIVITVNPKSSTPTTVNYSAVIIATPAKLEYKVGESFDDTGIVVHIVRNGDANSIYKTLTASDLAFNKTFSTASSNASASYIYNFTGEDGKSKSVTIKIDGIKVTAATTTYTYTAEMTAAPTKKTYTEGDTFDKAGMTYTIKANGTAITPTGDVIITAYTIQPADVGKNSINLTLSFNHNGTTNNVTLTVTGLTITAKIRTLEIYSITSVVMEKTKYPVGYRFTIDDIDYISYKATKNSYTQKLYAYNFDSYDNYMTIEVLDAEGNEKYRYYDEIQESDIQTKSNGTQYVELFVIIKDANGYDVESYPFEVTVGTSGVSFYDEDDDLVTVYDDIEDALDYTAEQDDEVEYLFDLDRVGYNESLTLKLGEDQKVSNTYELELNHNVVIDLNGKSLTFYSDAVEITGSNDDCTLTITNTSSTDAKFVYYDKSIILTVKKGEKLVFEYNEEVPGIYTVEISAGSNGKVTSTPTASNGKITVGHGTDVKFTITPNTGYILDTLKADGKTVAAANYTTSSTGVVTYTLKSVAKSQKVAVTFKEEVKEWSNPFIDVDKSDNYYSAVQFVYENNLFKGTTATKFAPTGTMTRATFVTVLGRLAGVDVSRYTGSSYIDLEYPRDSEYAPYIEWATKMGIVNGYGDGTFGPSNPITHQQMYVMMYRYTVYVENLPADYNPNIAINASDANEVADWARKEVQFASQNNFLVRVNSKITPTSYAKRSELAMLLEVYCDVILGMSEINEK